MMTISFASDSDIAVILKHDKWIRSEELKRKIEYQQVYVLRDSSNFIGWMRWSLFWDNTPFVNMLYILDDYQNKGYGKSVVEFWENEMARQGYTVLLTSTSSSETAQHFYKKLGYKAVGSFNLGEEPLEIIYSKTLQVVR